MMVSTNAVPARKDGIGGFIGSYRWTPMGKRRKTSRVTPVAPVPSSSTSSASAALRKLLEPFPPVDTPKLVFDSGSDPKIRILTQKSWGKLPIINPPKISKNWGLNKWVLNLTIDPCPGPALKENFEDWLGGVFSLHQIDTSGGSPCPWHWIQLVSVLLKDEPQLAVFHHISVELSYHWKLITKSSTKFPLWLIECHIFHLSTSNYNFDWLEKPSCSKGKANVFLSFFRGELLNFGGVHV